VLLGGDGDDAVNGGRGSDVAELGTGDDTFTWNPGDGSDTVNGNAGVDTMEFKGANVSETMSLAAAGSRVRFVRDVAAVTMDFATVETFALRTLGGTDRLTVGDLSGSDLDRADIDLSATGGAPDGLADAVTVDGTADKDHVKVETGDGLTTVNGLHTEVRVGGSDADVDHLQIDTLGGRDKLTISGKSAALIQVSTDLGEQ
jgi:hypothetical protein